MDRVWEVLSTMKSYIVNFCQRVCFSFEESDDDESSQNERARLLPDASSIGEASVESLPQQETTSYQRSLQGVAGSAPKQKNDEQELLNEILTVMTNNVLDVVLVNQPVDIVDFKKRSVEYSRRLNKEADNLIARHKSILKPTLTNLDEGLADVPPGEKWSDIGLADTDPMLVDEVAFRVKESLGARTFNCGDVGQVSEELSKVPDTVEEDQRLIDA